ncbi:hypothetical protein ACERK3_13035 [Phycisphaerales bacterium AB-hyl4]|uniref:Membrane associated rhomboid family serine protease n=1 Tax=Natronomicrosphaera hydrolytica TaxID=3242702 RepID=A0ABV4U6J0_9BACT
MLDRLERKFGRFAIPNLTLILIAFQALFYLAAVATTGQAFLDSMALVWERVFAGEVWLLLTFAFMPRFAHPLWFLISIYIFWLMGSALDREWGHFRYNIYLLTAFVLSALAGLLDPSAPVNNYYVFISVLLAFAWLYPEFQFLLFFIIPVKVKWIGIVVAVLTAGWFLQALGMRQWQEAAVLAAGIANFFLFFGGEMITRARNAHRRRVYETERAELAEQPFHKCVVCGKTDKSDPDAEFRYCPQCSDAACYCMDHIFEHEHR